jgi:DNA-binding NarL/FixJ family response regulator
LTQRERQVASAIADGLTNKEIARELCISLATVKCHVHSVLQKLHLTGRREIRRGLREIGEL